MKKTTLIYFAIPTAFSELKDHLFAEQKYIHRISHGMHHHENSGTAKQTGHGGK